MLRGLEVNMNSATVESAFIIVCNEHLKRRKKCILHKLCLGGQFANFSRMSFKDFEYLRNFIGLVISQRYTIYRRTVTA